MKTSENIVRLCAVAGLFLIAACGIKPTDMEPPKDSLENTFPRTYPDINTDPKINDKK